jgi:hypothetical protein
MLPIVNKTNDKHTNHMYQGNMDMFKTDTVILIVTVI